MSDDLIERLRGYGDGNNDLMDAAADRIENLEEEVDILISAIIRLASRIDIDSDAYDDRIEKLEAALRALKAMHHAGGIDDLQERDDRTYFMVCEALEGKDE